MAPKPLNINTIKNKHYEKINDGRGGGLITASM